MISGKTKTLLKKLQRLQPKLEAIHTSSLSADAVKATYLPFIPEIDGEKLDILVIPTSNVDDYSLIEVGPKLKNWKKVAKVWQRIYDDTYAANSLYVLLAHPRITGRKEFIGG